MTEHEWLEICNPYYMLQFVRPHATNRIWWLFQVACCRRILHLLCQDGQAAVHTADRYADGLATNEELDRAHERMCELTRSHTHPHPGACDAAVAAAVAARLAMMRYQSTEVSSYAATAVAWATGAGYHAAEGKAAFAAELAKHADLLRDFFSPRQLFGPRGYDPRWWQPEWRTPTVVAVAQSIYDERRFADLPVLADALEEAGCTSAELLAHCRGGGEHVRGCWAADLALAKE